MQQDQKTFSSWFLAPFVEVFGLSRLVAFLAAGAGLAIVVLGGFWFIRSIPPTTITISAGPEGSAYFANAEKYQALLARSGVTLKILPSAGSGENALRLANRSSGVDIGFVQGGTAGLPADLKLVSLGSVAYEPLLIFYRSNAPASQLASFAGRRLAIGPSGSGTRALVLNLLAANGIVEGGPTAFEDLDSPAAAKAILAGNVDAIFLMGDSASVDLIRELLRSPGVQLMDLSQAEAYARKFGYLNHFQIPQGAIDLAKNIPGADINLVGPTTELLARPGLNSALCDLLLEAAREVHGGAGLLKRKGEFPAPIQQDFPISPDAISYYKTGRSALYQHLPFRLASMVYPFLLSLGPALVVLVPALRIIPGLLRLRVRFLLFRWYRALMIFEQDLSADLTPERRLDLLARLDRIDESVNQMKVSPPYAEEFYWLRSNIAFVRARLAHR